MPSNEFLKPGTSTDVTLLYDQPKEGASRFGPYRAYRVRLPGGAEHTFFPPRSLFSELDQLNLRRGSVLRIQTSERVSQDGRVFPSFAIEAAEPVPEPETLPAGTASARPSANGSILACVALKAAVQSHGNIATTGVILETAETFLGWLRERAEAA